MSENEKSLLEQHIGTIMQVMVVGLLAWSLKTNVELTTSMGVVQSRLESLTITVNQGTTDRYRGSDAARDQAAIWAEFSRVEARFDRLERSKP